MTGRLIPSTGGNPILCYFHDGTDWRPLLIDTSGHGQVDVQTSALPSGAATAANQATEITALQLIDDLRAALHSVNTDELVVRGEDQLFSFKDVFAFHVTGNPSGANGYLQTGLVPAGLIWRITNLAGMDSTRALTAVWALLHGDVDDYYFHSNTTTIALGQLVSWAGHIDLVEGNRLRFRYIGCQAGDICDLWVTGYIMTREA